MATGSSPWRMSYPVPKLQRVA